MWEKRGAQNLVHDTWIDSTRYSKYLQAAVKYSMNFIEELHVILGVPVRKKHFFLLNGGIRFFP